LNLPSGGGTWIDYQPRHSCSLLPIGGEHGVLLGDCPEKNSCAITARACPDIAPVVMVAASPEGLRPKSHRRGPLNMCAPPP
jgi:hypothetical protein